MSSCLMPQLFLFAAILLLCCQAATHDELSQCGLSGVYKTRQSILESPNYPDNYPTNTCWDYVVRSPYRCPTKFHIQFLDFFLESSINCTNDYLAIGLENDGDDMDILCGQVIGIKKYHTPDGILRLRFLSDDSPWSTAKGFKLLVTRLACEREDLLRDNLNANDEDTEEVNAPPVQLQPPLSKLPQLFRNLSFQDQHIPYPVPPVFGFTFQPPPPGYFNGGGLYLPVRQRPFAGGGGHVQAVNQLAEDKEKPCTPTKTEASNSPVYPTLYPAYTGQEYPLNPAHGYPTNPAQGFPTNSAEGFPTNPTQGFPTNPGQRYPAINQQQLLPFLTDQYPTAWQTQRQPLLKSLDTQSRQLPQQQQQQFDPQLSTVDACCTSSFRQKRFYLSSPGFPRTAFTSLLPAQQRDCQFQLEKYATNVCRLRIEFKFFDFGQSFSGSGDIQGNGVVAIGMSKDACTEDFIEIDKDRFCGCRTGFVYSGLWGLGKKSIRMRMGYSGIPTSGFLLEVFQEECSSTQFIPSQLPTLGNNNILGTNFGAQQTNGLATPGLGGAGGQQQPVFGQQQLPIYQQQSFYPGGQYNGYQQQQQQQLLQLQQLQQQQMLQQQQQLLQPQQQQQSYQPLQTTSNLLPPQFWLPPLQQSNYNQNQYLPQFGRQSRNLDYARAASAQQPISVVETNSTRKEFYYFDGDEAFARNAKPTDEPDDLDHLSLMNASAAVKDRCSYSTMDALRLAVDTLWITKPTCYSPQRSWFGNVFG